MRVVSLKAAATAVVAGNKLLMREMSVNRNSTFTGRITKTRS